MNKKEKRPRVRSLSDKYESGAYLTRDELCELDDLMYELEPSPFDLLPTHMPAWASNDYDKSSRLVSGWDYNH